MTVRQLQLNRRAILAAAIAAPGLALFAQTGADVAAQTTPAASATATAAATTTQPPAVGEAGAPEWTFTVLQVQQPYQGQLSRPKQLDPSQMVIAAEVIITNSSDQPLSFAVADISLKDDAGIAYSAGTTLGSEPRVVSQDLPDGERTRGWVWFAVPKKTVATQLIFTGPSPMFRVALPHP